MPQQTCINPQTNLRQLTWMQLQLLSPPSWQSISNPKKLQLPKINCDRNQIASTPVPTVRAHFCGTWWLLSISSAEGTPFPMEHASYVFEPRDSMIGFWLRMVFQEYSLYNLFFLLTECMGQPDSSPVAWYRGTGWQKTVQGHIRD